MIRMKYQQPLREMCVFVAVMRLVQLLDPNHHKSWKQYLLRKKVYQLSRQGVLWVHKKVNEVRVVTKVVSSIMSLQTESETSSSFAF